MRDEHQVVKANADALIARLVISEERYLRPILST